MNALRLVISYPISLIVYGLSMALSVGPYLLLGREDAISLISRTTWLLDAIAAFLCIVAGAFTAPRRNAVVVSYVISSFPVLIVLKDLPNSDRQ